MKAIKDKDQTETEAIAIPSDEKSVLEIIPFGTNERIRLTANIVREMIAVPTRTGKVPDVKACIKFMMLCKARALNPFEGDAYMLGYDTQSGPQFSLITAHQVFLKRAEASKGFNGMESGVIVRRNAPEAGVMGAIEEREGDLVYENETLLGGWAKVFRKDREKPFYRRLKLSTFNTGQSRWVKDPAGMIVKCAEADALRTAFPTHLGGLYIQEETPPITVKGQVVVDEPVIPGVKEIPLNPNGGSGSGEQTHTGDKAPESKTAPAAPAKKKPKLKAKEPVPSSEPPPTPVSAASVFQDQLNDRLKVIGKTFDDFLAIAHKNDWLKPGRMYHDHDFKVFLEDEEWEVVQTQLEKA